MIPRLRTRTPLTALLVALILLVGLMVGAGSAAAATTCDRYASPAGSDLAPGTAGAPFRTIGKLLSSLAFGQTGCLVAGTYAGNIAFRTPGVTLTSATADRATIKGRVYVPSGVTDTTLSAVVVDGSQNTEWAIVQVFGSRFSLLDSEVTALDQNHNCVIVAGGSEGVVIRGNRIHGCGVPGLSQLVHGIYLQDTRRAQIVDNYLYDNQSGFAVQFWKNGDDSLVANNVMDRNLGGVILAGSTDNVSERNTIRNNVITNSVSRYGVRSYWGGTPGGGNVVDSNCFWQNKAADLTGSGYQATGNLFADPLYVNPSAGDYRLRSGSPCAGMGTALGSAGSGSTGGSTVAPLTVSIGSPTGGQTVSGTVPWTATPSEPVTKVEFYRDGSLVATDTSAPYEVSWDTTKVSNSYHTLLVRAYSADGKVDDDQIYVKVDNVVLAPFAVTITSPLIKQTVSGTVVWAASVSAPVTRVEFYRDGTLLASVASGPYQVSWDTTKVSNSYHTLLVRAYSADGKVDDDKIYVKVSNVR